MAGAELVAIELQLKGYDGVMADMRMLDGMLNSLRGRKNRLIIESNLAKAKRDVIAYEAEVKKLKAELEGTEKYIKGTKLVSEDWANANKKLEQTEKKLKDARQAAKEFQYALNNFKPTSFIQAFNKISSVTAHIGSALQSAGNALTKLTNPFRRFTTGLIAGAGYKALNMFTEGFSGAFERYDTMTNYARSLEALGLDASQKFVVGTGEAMDAIHNLNEAVLGLPTGLDEIVAAQKIYAGATGEMVKSTKTAIAANNTFLASATDAREQRFIQRYLASLASGAELTTTQWQSMARIAPLAMRAVAEELDYGGDKYQEFIQALSSGQIAGEKFLDAFIKVGTEGKVQAAANVMKTTWEGLAANIQNAARRMGEGLLSTLDDVFMKYNGRNLLQNLLGFDADGNEVGGGIKHFVDKVSQAVQGWVAAHPEQIAEFFDALKSIDWMSLLKGVGEGMLQLAGLIKKGADALQGVDLSRLGKFMVMGNLWGRGLTIAGGLIKGSRHIVGLIGATAFVAFIRNGGIFGAISRMLTGGKTAMETAETISAAEQAVKGASKVGKFSAGLSKVFAGWGQIATMVGGTALVGWGTFKAFKSMFKDLKEIVAITKEIDWKTASADLVAMGVFIATFIGVGTKVGAALGTEGLIGGGIFAGLTAIFAGTFWADMAMIKRGFKAIRDAANYIKEAEGILDELEFISNVPELKKKAQQAVAVFNAITDILQISRNNPITGEGTSGLKELDKESAKTIKNVANAAKNMQSAIESLNAINDTKLRTNNLLNVFGGLQHALTMFGTAIENMPSVFKDGTASSWASKMSATVGNFKTALNGLAGEDGILAMLPKIVSATQGMSSIGTFLNLPAKMKQIGGALKEVYSSLQGIGAGSYFASSIDSFRAGLKSLKFALKHLQEIQGMDIGDGIADKISSIIENLKNAFNQSGVDGLNATIVAFAASIKLALATFESLNGEIEIDVTLKLSQNFYSSRDAVIKEINKARKNVKNAAKPVTARITVSVIFSVVSNVANALARITRDRQRIQREAGAGNGPITGHISTGGRISRSGVLYRSGGGSIFKPRGTDKIPAMLTEGEYVHKKQAVDFFGTDFMQRVNAMDVRGAMQALLTKAGNATNIGRQSIINNTVNNNQRVVQNISTNNPNFAGARMGRFVGAL